MPTEKPHIAIVEDEHSLRSDLAEYLTTCGFEISAFSSAEDFYAAFASLACDLVLMDIGLPGESGLQAAQWVRERGSIGIVMLTAFKDPSDHVAGLWAGADAYLIKNTPLEVIEATCRSVLRRVVPGNDLLPAPAQAPPPTPGKVQPETGAWQLIPRRWVLVEPTGAEIPLTHTEAVLLGHLMRKAGQPVSRQSLLQALGKPDTPSNQRNLENYASRLRRKVLGLCELEIPLRMSYNQGYTFAAPAQVEGP